MIAEKMKDLVKNSSAIRAMFEEGKKLAAIYGADQVYDFSLGNPNVPAPAAVNDAIRQVLEQENTLEVHGYMNNSGFPQVRAAVADSLNRKHGTAFEERNILMTVGAAGGLNVIFKTLLNPGDEVVALAPFFGEYRSYVGNYDGVLKVAPADTETFLPDLKALEELITARTKAVIVNSPNNPSGVIYPEETIRAMADILKKKEQELGISIYLISDEPYRELAFDGVFVPYLTKYYHNTIVGYSFSKSLSLPGERLGYLVLPDSLDGAEEIRAAASVANRVLGFVNAPSLMQLAVARCLEEKADLEYYDKNRKALCQGLSACGFTYVRPQGAFYLFMKSPVEDEKEFCNKAKEHRILVVPGSSFACPGYVRIAYCVAYETIQNAMPQFRKLAEEYGLCPKTGDAV